MTNTFTTSKYCKLLTPKIIFTFSLLISSACNASDYYQEAANYYEKKKFNAAIIELKNLLTEDPQNVQARRLLGQAHLSLGNYVSAEKEFLRVIETKADDGTSLLLAETYLKQGNFEKVLASLSIDTFTDELQKSKAYSLLGHALISRNQIADAKQAFMDADALSTLPLSKIGQARIAAIENTPELAHSLLDQVLKENPQNFDATLIKGQLLSAEGLHQQALNYYDSALELENYNLPAQLARSETLILLDQFNEATQAINQVIKTHGKLPDAFFLKARLALAQEDYKTAQQSAEQLLNIAPEYRAAHFIIGAAHYAQNNFEQARVYLEKSLLNQPANVVGTRLLAATYLKLNEPNEVISLLEPLDSYQPIKDAGLLSILGMAFIQADKPELASEYFSRALEINPQLKEARVQLATSKLLEGSPSLAIAQLESLNLQKDDNLAKILLVASHLRNDNSDAALSLLEQYIDSAPGKPQFYHLKGLTLQLLEQPLEAKNAFEIALNKDPEYIPALLSLASIAVDEGSLKRAEDLTLQTLQANSTSFDAMLMMARIHHEQNNESQVIRWLSRAKDAHPQAVDPVRHLVNLYLKRKEPEKALNEAMKYLSTNPQSYAALSLSARVMIENQKFSEAKSHLEKILQKYPADIFHRRLLIQSFTELSLFNQALEEADKNLSLQTDDLATLVLKTEAQIQLKHFDPATNTIAEIRRLSPYKGTADQLTGDLLRAQGKITEALPFYERAFAIDKSANLAHSLHALYLTQSKPDLASATLENYLQLSPQDELARLKLASTYQQQNLNKSAVHHYEILLSDHPDNLIVLNNLAWLYLETGNSASLDYARRVYEAAPNNPELSDTYGWVLLQHGENKQALKILQKTVSSAPTNPDIRYHLAVALERNGEKSAAVKELKRLLRDFQGFSTEQDASNLLNRINN